MEATQAIMVVQETWYRHDAVAGLAGALVDGSNGTEGPDVDLWRVKSVADRPAGSRKPTGLV
jgi:hypothetical protein